MKDAMPFLSANTHKLCPSTSSIYNPWCRLLRCRLDILCATQSVSTTTQGQMSIVSIGATALVDVLPHPSQTVTSRNVSPITASPATTPRKNDSTMVNFSTGLMFSSIGFLSFLYGTIIPFPKVVVNLFPRVIRKIRYDHPPGRHPNKRLRHHLWLRIHPSTRRPLPRLPYR